MAVIVLRPSGDGSTAGWTREPASGTFASKIQEVVSENDGDTSYVQSPNASSGSMFVELDNVPVDFAPSTINSITIRVAHRRLNEPAMAVDDGTVNSRIVRANESTAISTTPTAVNSPIQAGYEQTSFSVSVTGTHAISDWNGARLQLTFTHSNNQTVDPVNQIRITAAEVEIDYVPEVPTTDGDGAATGSATVSAVGDSLEWDLIDTVDGETGEYSDLTVQPSTTYHYKVIPSNDSGNGPESNIASVTTPAEQADEGDGSITGGGSASAVGASITAAIGISVGSAVAESSGSLIASSVGEVAGSADVSSVGEGTAESVGSIAGAAEVGAQSEAGEAVIAGEGDISGSATVEGSGAAKI